MAEMALCSSHQAVFPRTLDCEPELGPSNEIICIGVRVNFEEGFHEYKIIFRLKLIFSEILEAAVWVVLIAGTRQCMSNLKMSAAQETTICK